jgi:hypothetical protein
MSSRGRRQHLHDSFVEVTDEDAAEELMTAFPPWDWSEIATRSDLRDEIGQLRTDFTNQLHAQVGGLRTELRQEIGDVRTDLRGDINELRIDMRAEFGRVWEALHEIRAEIRALRSWRWNTLLASAAIIASFIVGTLVR